MPSSGHSDRNPPRGSGWLVHPALPSSLLALALIGFLPGFVRDLPMPGGLEVEWWIHRQGTRALAWFSPLLLVLFFRTRRRGRLALLVTVCVASWLLWLHGDWQAHHQIANVSRIGETPIPAAYYGKVVLVSLLFLSPIGLFALLGRATLLDRYLLATCVAPFAFCLVAFFGIWLVFDLNDNLPDFRKGNTSPGNILAFYAAQIPLVFTQIAQPVLLVSTVFALSRMSRANEIVSMLGAGRSLWRIVLPLFLFGFYVAFVHTVFSYHWAPWAEGHKESLLEQFKRGEEQSTIAERQLYVNTDDRRTWYIGQIPFQLDREQLRILDIYERDEHQRIRLSIQAASAFWHWRDAAWEFRDGAVAVFQENGDLLSKDFFSSHTVSGWRETPWRIVSSRFEPDYLGVPGLLSYLRTHSNDRSARLQLYQTNLHNRWAAPWGCLVILFVAAPLGIVFSRRGALGGVAASIVLFAAILFVSELLLALGKGGFIPPAPAAWLTNLAFLCIGALIFHLRAGNRELRLPRLRRS
ncbi:MAG TPA: LptF/LptG family permease [Verrucomicrobiales bacterium]|nr:LptF/LptG family permease [Verrucomicrobiales bacterium]